VVLSICTLIGKSEYVSASSVFKGFIVSSSAVEPSSGFSI
jgi:hypothetical protein